MNQDLYNLIMALLPLVIFVSLIGAFIIGSIIHFVAVEIKWHKYNKGVR